MVLAAGLFVWFRPPSLAAPEGSTGPAPHVVIYNAEGGGARGIRSATYTLQTPSGSEQADVDLPLRTADGTGIHVAGFKTGDFLYLSIQNLDASGSVTCRISVDGYIVSENTSSGGYTIATCKGQVP